MSDAEMDKEFISFFEGLGYNVSWDHSRRTGAVWWEILSEGKLVIQIDKGVPLDILLEDLQQVKAGKTKWDGRHPVDYCISCEDSPELTAFLAKI
jgi:hypothetical protein